jgi:lysine biosynthesis protein LysW
MANCPACEAELLDDDYTDMEVGDQIDCPECGEPIEISSLSPLEFELASDDDEDDEELDDKDEVRDPEDEEEDEEDWDQ